MNNPEIEKALERIEAKIEHDPETGCANWRGGTTRGYAVFRIAGRINKTYRVARLLWEQVNGEIPEGYEIHHECFNRKCVRIGAGHCTITTHAENIRESAAQGSFDGERNSQAKLSNEEAGIIRNLHRGRPEMFPVDRLSELFRVSLRTAYGVLKHEVYRDREKVSQTA
jgi:hypothetical protein